jgi:hypothetical protein
LKEPEDYDPAFLATLQALEGTNSRVVHCCGANVDALFQGEGGSPPSTVILDYVYGVAAYRSWRSQRGDAIMDDYRQTHYANITPLPPAPQDDLDDTDNPDVASGPDDPDDPDYKPPEPGKRYRRRDESDLSKAMDEFNMVLMYIHGITPEEAAERRQKEIEREERAAQEASRSKVMEWRNHMDVY